MLPWELLTANVLMLIDIFVYLVFCFVISLSYELCRGICLGEAWDKKTEALAEFVYQLLLLLLPPERKASLSLLLAFISHHKLCDLSGTEVSNYK